MRALLLLLLLVSLKSIAQNNFPPIGQWREHLPYQGTISVTASPTRVYAATEYSLFSVHRGTGEVERFSRVSGLSETGISTIAYDEASQKLYVAYTNSNIDVLDNRGIHNIPDIKRATISGDKKIYHIYPDNDRVYLSTGLGVVVLDAVKLEVKDSWFIGNGGAYSRVNAFTKLNNFFYAATEQGLKRTSTTGGNPADFSQWTNVSGSNGLPAGSARGVVSLQNNLVTLVNDTLYRLGAAGWTRFFGNDFPIVSLQASGDQYLVVQRKANGSAQVVALNPNGTVASILQQPGVISFPLQAVRVENEYWVADLFGGLSRVRGGSFETFKLNSPHNIALGQLTVYNNIFYATAGAVNDSWNYQYNRSGIFEFKEGTWRSYNQYNDSRLDSVMDFVAIAIDPRDGSIWGGSFGGGLVHIKGNSTTIYKQASPLQETVGDPGSFRVAGLAFDSENNLWIANFGANRQLHVLRADGSWRSFSAPFFLSQNAAAQILIDDAGQKWIASPLGNGLMVFDHRQTFDNPSDDLWRIYRSGAGTGNLPANEVLSLAKDKSGFIWVGTTDGIGVIQCPGEAFTSGCETVWPVIRDGSFANYLFKGEVVRSIAVDGADRKWVATANGVWLINPDGDRVLQHFTESNSPLLSNDVKSIAIDGKTGEVYFATARGISSFRGTATEAEEDKGNVLVFPNPVPPQFTGTIAIKGLPANAFVKITEANGRLVYQARAQGGTVTWNGRDYRGNKVATGVYLVIAADDNKEEKAVAKIIFISNGR